MLVLPRNSDDQFLQTRVEDFIKTAVNVAAFDERELAVVRKPAIKANAKKQTKLYAVTYRVSQF